MDAEHERAREAFKARLAAEIADLRKQLEKWAEPLQWPHSTAVSYALLELGIDREIDLLGITEARECLLKTFDRQADKYKRSLQ
jgi:hypothetical protein